MIFSVVHLATNEFVTYSFIETMLCDESLKSNFNLRSTHLETLFYLVYKLIYIYIFNECIKVMLKRQSKSFKTPHVDSPSQDRGAQ